MRRVQERVISFITTFLIDLNAFLDGVVARKVCSFVGDCVLFQLGGSGEGLKRVVDEFMVPG